MTITLEATKYFQIELEIKVKLIDALQIKLSEKQDFLDAQFKKKLDASCEIEYLIQEVDEICDTYDLIHQIDTLCVKNGLIHQVDVSCDTSDLIHPILLLNDSTSSTKDRIDQFDVAFQTDELLMFDAQCDIEDVINQGQNVSSYNKYEE